MEKNYFGSMISCVTLSDLKLEKLFSGNAICCFLRFCKMETDCLQHIPLELLLSLDSSTLWPCGMFDRSYGCSQIWVILLNLPTGNTSKDLRS